MALIDDIGDILAKPARVTGIIHDELVAIREQFGDARRSEIVEQGDDLSVEDLIAPEDMVVTLSHGGYMKAQPVGEYRAQRRGGRGKQATATKEDDFVDQMFIANTHDFILCFSNRGRVYWLKVYNVPRGQRTSRGKPIVNLVPLIDSEKITAVLPVKEFADGHFVLMATAMGTVKKTPVADFSRPRQGGPLRRVRRPLDGPQRARRAWHDARQRAEGDRDAGRRGRVAVGADGDRERLRQAHADRRVHAPCARHQGHDRDPAIRAQRAGRRRGAGAR
jgi:DNA gyrase/topoisomerase IV subunit A